MNIRTLLDWRKVLIYSHRWLGIALGILFVSWCVSGAVLMYYGLPSLPSFNLGLMKPVRTLPVLRVTFADTKQTRIYMSPSHGQMTKSEIDDRIARWSLYGMHALDFSFLYQHRPLWDVVVRALLIGSTILSSTTLVPMLRRLKRHARRLATPLAGRRAAQRETVPSELNAGCSPRLMYAVER